MRVPKCDLIPHVNTLRYSNGTYRHLNVTLVSPLGGPHSIRGVGKLATGAALNRVAGHRPFLSVERGSSGARAIEPGADFMFMPAPPPLFGPAITTPIPGPAPAPLN